METRLLGGHGYHTQSVTSVPWPPKDNCTLHLYYVLPPVIFVDPHELALRADQYSFHYWGSRDLEKPVHAQPNEPNTLLVTAHTAEIDVPLHARYGAPSSSPNPEFQNIDVPWPTVFTSCSASPVQKHFQPTIALPKRVLSVLSASTTTANVIIPIPPHPSTVPPYANTVRIPLGSLPHLPLVQLGTSLTILVCFLWVALASWRAVARSVAPAPRSGPSSTHAVAAKAKAKKA